MLAADRVLESWRRSGRRITAPRRAILLWLEGNTAHPTAEEIYGALRRRVAGLCRTTVYNTLETLVKDGWVQRVPDAGRTRFDPNAEPHGHARCERCGALYDVPSKTHVKLSGGLPPGFVISDIRIDITGRCAGCTRKAHGR